MFLLLIFFWSLCNFSYTFSVSLLSLYFSLFFLIFFNFIVQHFYVFHVFFYLVIYSISSYQIFHCISFSWWHFYISLVFLKKTQFFKIFLVENFPILFLVIYYVFCFSWPLVVFFLLIFLVTIFFPFLWFFLKFTCFLDCCSILSHVTLLLRVFLLLKQKYYFLLSI